MAEHPTTFLHFVLGKGGVGKSTIAAALALALAKRGADVLSLELGASSGLARAFGVHLSSPGEIVRTKSGVSVSYFEGAAAFSEFLSRRVRLGALGARLFQSPQYRAFVQAAPGLKELMAMGKVQDEVLFSKRWDAVVVDGGASGHALEHLRMPGATAATFRRGRVHRESRRVDALLRDAERTRIHVVTTAEEMPVLEAIESTGRIRHELGMPLGWLVMNRCLPSPPSGIEAFTRRLERTSHDEPRLDGAQRQVLLTAKRALGWIEIQERYVAELSSATGVVPLRLPRVVEGSAAFELQGQLLAELK